MARENPKKPKSLHENSLLFAAGDLYQVYCLKISRNPSYKCYKPSLSGSYSFKIHSRRLRSHSAFFRPPSCVRGQRCLHGTTAGQNTGQAGLAVLIAGNGHILSVTTYRRKSCCGSIYSRLGTIV